MENVFVCFISTHHGSATLYVELAAASRLPLQMVWRTTGVGHTIGKSDVFVPAGGGAWGRCIV